MFFQLGEIMFNNNKENNTKQLWLNILINKNINIKNIFTS